MGKFDNIYKSLGIEKPSGFFPSPALVAPQFQKAVEMAHEQYPVLSKYNFEIQPALKTSDAPGLIEFISPQERAGDNVPKIEIYNDSLDDKTLSGLIAGDMLHYLPEVDKKYAELKRKYIQTLSSGDIEFAKQRHGEDVSKYKSTIQDFDAWLELSWSDSLIRGYLNKNPEWMKAYTPEQIKVLKQIEDYLKTPSNNSKKTINNYFSLYNTLKNVEAINAEDAIIQQQKQAEEQQYIAGLTANVEQAAAESAYNKAMKAAESGQPMTLDPLTSFIEKRTSKRKQTVSQKLRDIASPEYGREVQLGKMALGAIGGAAELAGGVKELLAVPQFEQPRTVGVAPSGVPISYRPEISKPPGTVEFVQEETEKKIEALGGRDINTAVGKFIFDAIPITKTEKAVSKALPFLARKSATRVAERVYGEEFVKNAVKLGATGVAYETMEQGRFAPEAFPMWATFAVAEPLLRGAGKALVKNEGLLKGEVGALGGKPSPASKPLIFSKSNIPSMLKDAQDKMAKLWEKYGLFETFTEEGGIASRYGKELGERKKALRGMEFLSMSRINEKYKPLLDRLSQHNKVPADGDFLEPYQLVDRILLKNHTESKMSPYGEGWQAGAELPADILEQNAKTEMLLNGLKSSDDPALVALAADAEAAAREVVLINREIISSPEAMNVLGDLRDAYLSANPQYVPLKRVVEAMDISEGTASKAGSLKRAKGSKLPIKSPLVNSITNFASLDAFFKRENWKHDMLVTMAETGKATPVKAKTELGKIDKAGLEYLKETGVPLTDKEQVDLMTGLRGPKNVYANETANMYGGEWAKWRIDDPEMLKIFNDRPPAWKGIIHFVDSGFKLQKDIFRAGVTLSPAFMERNLFRDFGTYMTLDDNIGKGFMAGLTRVWPQTVKTLAHYYPQAIMMQIGKANPEVAARFVEYQKRGLGSAGLYASEQNIEKWIADNVRKDVVALTPKQIPGKMWESWKNLGNIVEMLPRLTAAEREYQKLFKEGFVSVEEALDRAAARGKEITIDFNEMGYTTRKIGRYVPFFTAGLGAMRTMGRAFVRDPGGFMGRGFALITAPALLNWARIKDKDWYNGLTTQDKLMYFPVTEHFHIPLPYDTGVIFSGIPIQIADRLYEFYRVEKGLDPNGAKNSVLKDFGIDISMLGPSAPLPPALSLAVGIATNKDPFFGSYIDNPYEKMSETPAQYRQKPSTSETSKLATKALSRTGVEISPNMLDFAIRSQGGTLGRDITKLADVAILAARREKRVKAVPPGGSFNVFASPFITKNPMHTTYSRHIERFYSNYNDVMKTVNGFDNRIENKDLKEAQRILKRNEWKFNAYEEVESSMKEFNEIYKIYKQLADPRTLVYTDASDNEYPVDRKTKTEILDMYAEKMNKLVMDMNIAFEIYRKDAVK